MASKRLNIGQVEVTFFDGSTRDFWIQKSGKTIWINDHIVHASNQGSFKGIIHEIEILTNIPIARDSLDEYVTKWKITGPDHHKL